MPSRSMRLARLGLFASAIALAAPAAYADPLACTTAGYKAAAGLVAAVADNALTVTWDGEKNQELRLRFTVNVGVPTIADLSVRAKGGQWTTLAGGATPEYKVVSGVRRATDQQLKPLTALGVKITPQILDMIRWEAFWDSPLNVPGDTVAHGGATPPMNGIADQPG